MEISSVMGELMYILLNYEKGRIKTGIWTSKYLSSFNESLKMISTMLSFLQTEHRTEIQEIRPVLKFIKQNIGKIFPPVKVECKNIFKCSMIFKSTPEKKYQEINELMQTLINECNYWLINKGKKYKTNVTSLLMALHNLPKVYLNPEADTIFKIGVAPIRVDEALNYAYSYLKLKENLK